MIDACFSAAWIDYFKPIKDKLVDKKITVTIQVVSGLDEESYGKLFSIAFSTLQKLDMKCLDVTRRTGKYNINYLQCPSAWSSDDAIQKRIETEDIVVACGIRLMTNSNIYKDVMEYCMEQDSQFKIYVEHVHFYNDVDILPRFVDNLGLFIKDINKGSAEILQFKLKHYKDGTPLMLVHFLWNNNHFALHIHFDATTADTWPGNPTTLKTADVIRTEISPGLFADSEAEDTKSDPESFARNLLNKAIRRCKVFIDKRDASLWKTKDKWNKTRKDPFIPDLAGVVHSLRSRTANLEINS